MMKISSVSLCILVSALLVCLASVTQAKDGQRPNVLFIIVDDLNDLPYQPDGKPLVPTPNIDRLKAMGTTFTNAHTNNPLCAPARASMMFGLYPQTTGLYWFEQWQENGIYKESVPLETNLRNGGYQVLSTGKVYHGGNVGNFNEFGPIHDFGPWPWDGREETKFGFIPHPQQMFLYEGEDADVDFKWEHVFGPLSEVPDWPADPESGVPGYKGWTLRGKPYRYVNAQDRDPIADELITAWVSQVIERQHTQPFALFTGLVRTHTPLYAPDDYFERFPLDSIELPKVIPNDLDDTAGALGNEELYGFRRYNMLVRHEDRDLLRKWLQAYMACVSFIDDQVGVILDALEKSPYRDDTIIILTSDHGFHMGEKDFLYKGSLWEPSTRIPMIIAGVPQAPQGTTCTHPVSLIDLYPTINDLCGLNKDPNKDGNGYALEGHSMLPLILDPAKGQWNGPDVAITSIPGKNHMHHRVYEGTLFPHFSVRGERFRYTLTSGGEEELYDHEVDPLEWNNLADDRDYHVIKESLKAQLIALRDGDRWTTLQASGAWQNSVSGSRLEQDGDVIHLSGEKGAVLQANAAYPNFELELDVKIPQGEFFRIAYRGDSGFGITIPTLGSAEAEYSKFKPGQWNRYRIRVHNERQQLWINNRYVADTLYDPQDIFFRPKSSEGMSLTHKRASEIHITYGGGPEGMEIHRARIRPL